MRRTALTVVASVAVLAGCSTSSTAAPDANAETCAFLEGGAYEDAVDLFFDFTDDPTSVATEDVDPVVDRFTNAADTANGELAAALARAAGELAAVRDRVDGGGSEIDIDYEALNDSLQVVGDTCTDD
ncbi:hypothetical protein [Marisediminicola sp. LYQ134]|uniref:hypothetical protein n=1 Tax=Marisediminicola sp. LYQ134 TaxID=3391061 RepID=UPI00398355D9